MGVLAFFSPNNLILSYLTVVFVLSGLVINFLQLLTFVFLWPFSRSAYRKLNGFLVNYYWTEIIWLAEWWANIRLRIFCDKDVVPTLGRDKAVALCNHASDVDWLFGWMIAHNYDCLGGAKCLLKKLLAFVPVLGWSWWFLEYIFLLRNWEKDKSHLARSFKSLSDFPMPFWVVIFAEGTRFTPEKHAKSVKFSRENNLPEFKNVLYPRTKGWKLVMSELRKHVDCVYDCTFAFPTVPGLGDLLDGVAQDVFVYIRRTPIAELPAGDDGCEQWCVETYQKMDERLEEFKKHGKFLGHEEPQTRRVLPLVVLLGWTAFFTALFGYRYLPPILAGDTNVILGFIATLIFGELFLRLIKWFAKKSQPKKGKGEKKAE